MTITSRDKQGTIIKFSGHSDDVIVWEMINPHLGHQGVTSGQFTHDGSGTTHILVKTIGGARGVHVYAMYNGCWHFSVCQLEESRKIPNNWEITIDQMDDHEYSARLTIDAYKTAGELLQVPWISDTRIKRQVSELAWDAKPCPKGFICVHEVLCAGATR